MTDDLPKDLSDDLRALDAVLHRIREHAIAPATEPQLIARANALYRQRRAREAIFGAHANLFGEPSWDILLDLFVQGARGNRVSISSASLSAGVALTTALRHLNMLIERGLVERQADGVDRRRHHARLTTLGHAMMVRYLSALTPVE